MPPLTLAEPQGQGLYRVHSAYTDDPLDELPEASAVCAMIADLAQAASEAQGQNAGIGFHCGAFTISGRLVALTGAHRAGKSTLVSRLTAEPDLRVFCDDVLALSKDGTGSALGIAPRLRLPLPDSVTDAFREHVGASLGPADDRYGYVLSPNLARHGATAPLCAIVMLDRRAGQRAGFHQMPPEEALRLLVEQSITAYDDAGDAYATARRIVSGVAVLRLVYQDLEDAVCLLRQAFGGETILPEDLPVGAPLADEPGAVPEPAPAPVAVETVWRRAAGIGLRHVGQSAFLWWPGDGMLWQLNPTGHAIWTLLELPGSARDIAAALAEIFPAVPPDRLEADCAMLMARLAAEGFILTA
ncbi:MAG: PqqD family protein [Pseudorhodobacter sp.]